MSEEQSVCPSCGEAVEVGAATCPHCGVDIRTGEAYETQVKRAKGPAGPRARVARHLGFGLTVVFGLLLIGGFLYQDRIIKVFRDNPFPYTDYIQRIEDIRALAAQGKPDQARREGETLIQELMAIDQSIVIEVAPGTVQAQSRGGPSKAVRRAEKRLIQNLIKKAKFELSQLPQA